MYINEAFESEISTDVRTPIGTISHIYVSLVKNISGNIVYDHLSYSEKK